MLSSILRQLFYGFMEDLLHGSTRKHVFQFNWPSYCPGKTFLSDILQYLLISVPPRHQIKFFWGNLSLSIWQASDLLPSAMDEQSSIHKQKCMPFVTIPKSESGKYCFPSQLPIDCTRHSPQFQFASMDFFAFDCTSSSGPSLLSGMAY